MRRVHGRDAIFLYMDTPTNPFHMAFMGVFDPSTVPGGVADDRELYVRLADLLEQRLHLFPPFRQRLVEVPLHLGHPVFVEDPAFDLAYHLRRVAVPAPGGRREVEEVVGDLLSRPLDRDHPLWEITLIEGLEDGRWALVAKAHHMIVDGVGGNEILVNLLDLTPEVRPVDPPAEAWGPETVPSDLRLLAGAALANLTSPPQALRSVAKTAGTLAGVLADRRRRQLEAPLATLGPRTQLNSTLSARRRVAFGRIAFADVKRVKDAFGVKVNDVVLALCGRALRGFLSDLGEVPGTQLVAAVPISIRAGDGEALGNRVAGMTVPLADDRADVGEQLAAIAAVTGPAREHLGAITADLMTEWTEFATPTLAAQAFRFYSGFNLSRRHRPVANLTISNVPGPDIPLYVAGSQMQSMYPMGPVVHGQALNVTVVSYRGTMFVGLVADAAVVADLEPLLGHVDKALAELLEAAAAR